MSQLFSQLPWLPFALLTTLSWILYHTAAKFAGGTIQPTLGSAIAGATALTVGLVAHFVFKFGGEQVTTTKQGILFAILLGLGTVLGDIFYVWTYSKNAPASIAGPLTLILLTVVLGLIGIFIYKEGMTSTKFVGLILGIISLYLLTK